MAWHGMAWHPRALSSRLSLFSQAQCELSFEELVAPDTQRASRGLSAIVRSGGDRVHVFVYKTEFIMEWIETAHSDPMTREQLTKDQIIEVTPDECGAAA